MSHYYGKFTWCLLVLIGGNAARFLRFALLVMLLSMVVPHQEISLPSLKHVDLRVKKRSSAASRNSTRLRSLLMGHDRLVDGGLAINYAADMNLMLKQMQDFVGAVRVIPETWNASQIKLVISQIQVFIGARLCETIVGLASWVSKLSITDSTKVKDIDKDLIGEMPALPPRPEPTAVSLILTLECITANGCQIRALLTKHLSHLQKLVATSAARTKAKMQANA